MIGGIYPGSMYPAGIPVYGRTPEPLSGPPLRVRRVTQGTPNLTVTDGQPQIRRKMSGHPNLLDVEQST